MLTIRHLDDGGCRRIEFADVAAALDGTGLVWIDLQAPDDAEAAIVNAPVLGLEPLIIEDMLEDSHLPKLDAYADQALLTVHAIAVERSGLEVDTAELDIVAKRNLVITHHADPITSVQLVGERLDEHGSHGLERPALLVHYVLDVMADVFAPFVDLMERRLELIEEDVLSRPTKTTRREIFHLQRDLIQLRRVVLPQAEVVRRLGRDSIEVFERRDVPLFRDVYDHLHRMGELIESYRQLVLHAHDNYRSALDDDVNAMLKVLTMFSALLLPISVIAGIYGMNFVHMPELDERWAYPIVWAVFGVIVVGGLAVFRAQGWIGGAAEDAVQERRLRLGHALEIPVLGQVLKVPAYGARAVLQTTRQVVGLPRWIARRVTRADDAPADGAADDALDDEDA